MELFRPFEPVQTDTLPTGSNWIGQVKWDGVRIVAHAREGQVNLVNRHGRDRTKAYPELVESLAPLARQGCILDGEVVAFAHGKPSFYRVLQRDRARHPANVQVLCSQLPVVYMVFDIVWAGGRPLHGLPFADKLVLLKDGGQMLLSVCKRQVVQGTSSGPNDVKDHVDDGQLTAEYLNIGRMARPIAL